MLKLSSIDYHYNDHMPVLKNVNLTIKQGECVLICGPSGSGKTTLTRIANGLIPFHLGGALQGDVELDGVPLNDLTDRERIEWTGTVFQNPRRQHFANSAMDELILTSQNLGIDRDVIDHRVKSITQQLGIEELVNCSLFHLSGGEKQIISLASALVHQPKLLILDEVTANLDTATIERIAEILTLLKQQGMTILLADHRLAWSLKFVDRYVYLEDGEIKHQWTAVEIQQLSEHERQDLGLRSLNQEQLTTTINRSTASSFNNHDDWQIENISIGYNKPLLPQVNLSFEPGAVIGIMGRNGSGKSTLAKTLVGLMDPLTGSINYQGQNLNAQERLDKSSLVLQDVNYQLFNETVEKDIKMNSESVLSLDHLLASLHLDDLRDRHPYTLSGGQKQRVAIAGAIYSDKDLLIYDEPTSGMDYRQMIAFADMVKQLKEKGYTQIIISHDYELVDACCDEVLNIDYAFASK